MASLRHYPCKINSCVSPWPLHKADKYKVCYKKKKQKVVFATSLKNTAPHYTITWSLE